ncbi:hypothetical protein JI735_33945 (plasmid) [Paenibacillus sonchi]|uniref:Uncharacterized protein n=1 Tax=Paenibacillus sonchi TaxID=373687 RepID=A0A974PJI3_9BACL|nr:hypothetical protein [Paenibacillus sonchi]QQZ64653.1 hypothetical protein JI735_33945 [Paenibacillus sonchi]
MDYIVKLAFVLLIFLYSWFFQSQNQEWDVQRSLLKDANNIAVHDAAQEISENDLFHGRLIIEPTTAFETFKTSLESNLGLDDSLDPKKGSRLHSAVKIKKFVILDESSGVSFPFLYEDSEFGITKYIQGPSVIAVIETAHPVLVSRSKSVEPIVVPAVQEYKFNK